MSVQYFEEHPYSDMADLLPRALLKEVLMTHEENELEKLEADVKTSKAKHAIMLLARDRAIEAFIPKPVLAPVPKMVKAKAKKAPGKQLAPRWAASPDENSKVVHTWIERYLPKDARVRLDETRGRFVVCFLHRTPRSVSWTEQGFTAAAALVLHIAWSAHVEAYRTNPPFDLDGLVAELDLAL